MTLTTEYEQSSFERTSLTEFCFFLFFLCSTSSKKQSQTIWIKSIINIVIPSTCSGMKMIELCGWSRRFAGEPPVTSGAAVVVVVVIDGARCSRKG